MATFTWQGSTYGSWAAASDWTPNGGPPGPGDVAVFNADRGGEYVEGNGTADRVICHDMQGYFEGSLTLTGTTGTALTITGADALYFESKVRAPTVSIKDSGPVFFESALRAVSVSFEDSSVTFEGALITSHLAISDSGILLEGGLVNTGSVIVGGSGDSDLVVESSARIGYQGERGNLILANRVGGAGSVSVEGTLDVANLMKVGAGGTGTLTVDQGAMTHAGHLVVADGSGVTLGGFKASASSFAVLTMGSGTIETGGSVDGAGKLSARRGIVNDGTIAAHGYMRIGGDVTDNGTMNIGSGAVIHIVGEVLGTGTIAFATTGSADLVIGASPTIDPTLTGFGAGDEIRALNVDNVSYDPASGHLTLFSGGAGAGMLTLGGSYNANGFNVTVQGHQGIITYGAAGSHIG